MGMIFEEKNEELSKLVIESEFCQIMYMIFHGLYNNPKTICERLITPRDETRLVYFKKGRILTKPNLIARASAGLIPYLGEWIQDADIQLQTGVKIELFCPNSEVINYQLNTLDDGFVETIYQRTNSLVRGYSSLYSNPDARMYFYNLLYELDMIKGQE